MAGDSSKPDVETIVLSVRQLVSLPRGPDGLRSSRARSPGGVVEREAALLLPPDLRIDTQDVLRLRADQAVPLDETDAQDAAAEAGKAREERERSALPESAAFVARGQFAAGHAWRSGDDSLIDDAALRSLVAEIVREELRGQAGRTASANIRRLIRREIRIALAADDGKASVSQTGPDTTESSDADTVAHPKPYD